MSGAAPPDPSSDEADLPEPKIGTVRLFDGLPEQVKRQLQDGLFLALGRAEESAVRVGTLWGLLEHLDKLYQAVQANQFGAAVKDHGSFTTVPGGRELEVLPAHAGSFAIPLRLQAPDGQLVGQDYAELDALMRLLDPGADLAEELPVLPDRIGHELRKLYLVLARAGTSLRVEMVREEKAISDLEIGADEAQVKADWLETKTSHDLGTQTLRGKLFRVDTKKMEVRIDVPEEPDGEPNVERATYKEDQLEDLRSALKHQVEMEVSVSEDRRPYERSVTNPKLSVNWVRRVEGSDADAED